MCLTLFSLQTLQKYTREYLFDKFRNEYHQQRPPSRHPLPHRVPQGLPPMGPLSHGSRPILAIDTAPHAAANRHPSLSAPRDVLGGEVHSPPITRSIPDALPTSISARGPGPSKSSLSQVNR